MISIEAYRAAIGRYYCKAVSSTQNIHVNSCSCQRYEKGISKSSRSNMNTMMKLGFYEEIEYLETSDYSSTFTENCTDLQFCITAIESMYDVSF